MSDLSKPPFAIRNVRLFLAFRVLFNARFYYPVFSVLFLDFGLTLAQFALLNVVWAVSIVVCEVPSGALADILGRRNLLVLAGGLMVVEIMLWAFVPRDNLHLLFWVFVLNRILSGMAEAAASGADEALAYDSLVRYGNPADWSRVLERQIQLQSAGFVMVMTLGGLVYDPHFVQGALHLVGFDATVTRAATLRLPIYLTLATAVLTLLSALGMQEVSDSQQRAAASPSLLAESLKLIWQAARWIFRTPLVLGLMLFGLLYDSVVRMLLTMASQYYRLIGVPEAWFGALGSLLALSGLVMPVLARRLVTRCSLAFNLLLIAGIILAGLVGMAQLQNYAGLAPALLLFGSFNLVGFFLSYYLNRLTDSAQRATVLSFKGLFLNLGYGMIGLLYSFLLALLRGQVPPSVGAVQEELLKNRIFAESLPWFGWYFGICFLLLLGCFTRTFYRSRSFREALKRP
ncbi:MFS transporter [Pelobacter seleniigenes]|uniref:MFS transporter n=1 Tax=Pelobacter seleniigenes TaxID=407188 RepID=UPI0004A6D9F4|nr:MFS transporter [Pelobacter seleniigenes]